MVSGIGLGGFASGFQKQEAINNQQNYQQGLLQLEQQRMQQQEKNQQRAEYMKLREQAVADMQNTVTAVKNAHPDWGEAQLMSFPALAHQRDQLSGFDKNLGLDPNGAGSILAGMVAGKSQIETERAVAQAKDPNRQALEASEIDKNKAAAENLRTNAKAVSGQGDETTDFFAQQLLEGNQNVLTGFSRSASGVAMRMKIQQRAAQMAVEQGLSPSDVNANVAKFMGEKAGANALGRREAQVIGAATTATQTAPRVLEASENVDRTQYPSINSVLLAVEKGTGDTNVVRLGIAINTFVNNYARALGAGNSAITDSARKEAMDNLNAAWSKGQIGAAIDQMLNKELPSEIAGAKSGMKTFLSTTGKSGGKPQYKFNPDTGELE